MSPGQLLLFAVGGLANAAYLFIVAAGLSLVFGALRVINMAHGSLYMVAAFVTVVIANQVGANLGFWAGLLVAVAVTGLIGGVVEILVLRRVYGREHLVQLLGTYAVSLVVAGGVRIVFGANYRTVASPIPGHFDVGGYSYASYSLFMIAAAIVIAAGVWAMLYRTNLGRNIRAAVADPDLLNATGVNVTRLYTPVFVIGAGLAGLGGAIVAPSQAIGSSIVGMVVSFGLVIPATSPFALAFVFIIMTAVLIVRPRGLFGLPES